MKKTKTNLCSHLSSANNYRFSRNQSLSSYLIIGIALMLCGSLSMAQEMDTDIPVGWAAVPGNGVASTTGGGNGDVVTATTAGQLSGYAGSSQPLVIIVEGTLSGSGAINVASNKTIIGKGADARLSGVGLNLSNVSNVIIRNLTISGSTDAIATRGSHHVWIDHCNVSACGDGLIDITKQSDYHTVSWTRLSNHDKTMLINSGTSQPDDLNKLNITLHHLWFDGTNQRNPRAAYGKIHVFNCFLKNNTAYGIGLHSQCRVLAERNYFDHVSNPISQMYRPDPNDIHHGFCESVDNIFAGCTGDRDDEGIGFPVNHYYRYDFVFDSAAKVPSIVQSNAGPNEKYEKLGLMPVPGNGDKNVGTNSTLSWTKGQSATVYIVHFGTDIHQLADSTVSGQTFIPGTLDSATVYYWSVDQVTSIDTIRGKVWVFETSTGLPSVSITSPASKTNLPAQPSAVTINTNATDGNGSIVKVEFFRGITSLGVDSIYPYSYTWENALAGEHIISAKATDNQDNTVTSPLVYINKENNPPSVSIASPANDTTFDAPAGIEIHANASDNDGSITSVKFYRGTTFLGIDNISPYSFTWSGVTNGTYSITAVATDNFEATTTSAAITITVTNVTGIIAGDYDQLVKIYPVPTSNLLTIEWERAPDEEVNISLSDISGKVLRSVKANGIRQTLDMSGLPNGAYLIKVSGKNKEVIKQVAKQ